jgi:V8-like Glu-specific endopeptidase
MKYFLSMLLALSMAISPIQACANSLPKQVINTTHRIEMTVTTPDDSTSGSDDFYGTTGDVCSSTAIGPHALLTASHCDLGASTVKVDDVEAVITSRVVDGNDHTIYMVNITFHDYAKFEKNDERSLKMGDEVWLRGNAFGLNQLIRYGHFAGAIVKDTSDVTSGTTQTIYMFDINGGPGDSGSGIFDNDGKIVAVTTYGFSGDGFVMLGSLTMHFTPAQLKQAEK